MNKKRKMPEQRR